MKKYEHPELEIVELINFDIIYTSYPSIEEDDDSNDGDWI